MFNNPIFGIDKAGAFGGIADSLSSNPFGGASLNVGGFTGSAPSYGGSGGFNWGQAGGLLNMANFGLGLMSQANTRDSFNAMQNLSGFMRDLDFGTNIFAQNKDIFEQKDAPGWVAKFTRDDPNYRAVEARRVMMNPGLAGRYSTFVA